MPSLELDTCPIQTAETNHPADHLDDCVETGVSRRRPSVDSLGARYSLQRLDSDSEKKMMPLWVRRMLALGGGCTGEEHFIIRAFLVLCPVLNMVVTCFLWWLLGVPAVPDCVTFLAITPIFWIVMYGIRAGFLQSGTLWSLAKNLDSTGRILSAYEAKTHVVFYSIFVESFIYYGAMMVLGLGLDVSGRAASLSDVEVVLGWIAGALSLLFLHPLNQFTVKLLPLLFVMTYDLLVEDMHRFRKFVDDLFADAGHNKGGTTDLIGKLQAHECSLREHMALVNDVLGPNLGKLLSLLFVMMSFMVIYGILSVKLHDNGVLAGLYGWVGLVMFTLQLVLLKGAARVGDTWSQLLDDVNTPVICVHSASILQIPLADRLANLQHVGIQIWGYSITSRSVFSLGATMGSGIFLAVLGVLLSM